MQIIKTVSYLDFRKYNLKHTNTQINPQTNGKNIPFPQYSRQNYKITYSWKKKEKQQQKQTKEKMEESILSPPCCRNRGHTWN